MYSTESTEKKSNLYAIKPLFGIFLGFCNTYRLPPFPIWKNGISKVKEKFPLGILLVNDRQKKNNNNKHRKREVFDSYYIRFLHLSFV